MGTGAVKIENDSTVLFKGHKSGPFDYSEVIWQIWHHWQWNFIISICPLLELWQRGILSKINDFLSVHYQDLEYSSYGVNLDASLMEVYGG